MEDLLMHLDRSITLTTFCLLVYCLWFFKSPGSISVAAFGFLLVQLSSFFMINALIVDGVLTDPLLVRIAWYFGFAFINLAAIFLISRMHSWLDIEFEPSAAFTVRCLQFMAVLQVVSFIDRHYFNDVLALIYHYAIPAVNLAVLIYLISSVAMASIRNSRADFFKGGS